MSNQSEILKQNLKNEILRNYPNISEASLSERELTKAEVTAMSAREYYFHSLYNSKNVELALSSESRKAAGKAEAAKLKAKRLWNNPQSPEDLEASLAEVRKFVALYRQFDGKNLEDRNAMIDYLKQHHLLITLPNLQRAFEHLVLAGELTLLPEQINAAWESEVTGYKLQHHPHLAELLRAHPIVDAATAEQKRISQLSADDYKKQYLQPEINQHEVAALEREQREFKIRHPEVDFDVEGVWDVIVDAIHESPLCTGINYNSLEYIIRTEPLLAKLKSMDALWTTTKETEYRAGISSLVDKRLQKPPLPAKEISIEEGRKKTWTHRQILDMTADEYQQNREKYGAEFERAVDEAF